MNNPFVSSCLRPCTLALALALQPMLLAQVANPPSDVPAEKPAVELSPFRVDASQDNGYSVNRDVSGSRLNTDLKDISAPITIFTEQMLQDLNAVNVNQALDYAPSTQYDEVGAANQDFTNTPIRVRGLRGATPDASSTTQDFFPAYDDLDTYKVDRIGFDRGPNSILFGVGVPAGIITASTKQALMRNQYELEARFDSWGSARGMLDINRELIRNRLALRVAAVDQYTTSEVKPQYRKDKRVFVTSTAKLVDKPNFRTTLRGNYEWIDGDDLYPNGTLPRDQITLWLASGRPTSSVVGAGANAATRPVGTVNQATANKLVYINDPRVPILNWRNMLAATGNDGAILTEDVYPYDVNIKGSDGIAPRHIEHSTAFLEQQIGPNFFVELAAFHGEEDRQWPIKVGGVALSADPNQFLPDGTPNPNVGKYFVEYNGSTENRLGHIEVYRATANYKLNFSDFNSTLGKWLGRHELFGLFERSSYDKRNEQLQVVNTTPLAGFPTALNNAQNVLNIRSYLDFANGIYSFKPGNIRGTYAGNGVTARAMPVLAQLASRQVFNSRVFAMQNYFWSDRIVTTFGWREDAITTYAGAPVADALGLFPLSRTLEVKRLSSGKLHPDSKGVVFHVFPWISLHYNESNNYSGLAAAERDLAGNNIPATAGEGKDYGVRLDLIKGTLTLDFDAYETSQVNAFGNAAAATEINQFWDLLNRPDLKVSPFPASKDTFDVAAKGWEGTLIFNPTPNWRIYGTVAYNKASQANVYPVSQAYIAKYLSTWQAIGNQVIADGRTVTQAIADMNDTLLLRRAQQGAQEYNQRKWTGSLVTNYSFTRGFLKNAYVGGTALFRGEAIVAYPLFATGAPDVAHPFVEKGYTTVNINLGYRMRVKERYNWRTQLAIQNALDYDGRILVTQRSSVGRANSAGTRYMPGTNVVVTTELKF